jgi:trehalose synthase
MTLPQVAVDKLSLSRFDTVLSAEGREALQRTVALGTKLLSGRVVWTVNSTASGGGVAEMLRSLVGYVDGAGIDARWVLAEGDPDFFRVTKRLHNRLHGSVGDGGPLGDEEQDVYFRRCERNSAALLQSAGSGDVVILHDPQTAGMVPSLVGAGLTVVWRAHIGLDMPNDLAREAWAFLRGYVEPAHAYVFSRQTYAWEGLDPGRLHVIPPSVDAFAPKNQQLAFTEIVTILGASGLAADGRGDGRAAFQRLDGSVGIVRRRARVIEEAPVPLDRPLVTQVSRWDRLKDPIGVLIGFVEHVTPEADPHLVLAGPDVDAVTDDPEGAEVLAEVRKEWERLPTAVRSRIHLAQLPMDDLDENAAIVNALQRRSDVVVQKSIAEGFGLTVSEAMWKGRPVVASRVGGIQDQVTDGRCGYLVDPDDLPAFGQRVSALLNDPALAERMGMAAQVRVRDHFLGPRHLGQWVAVLAGVVTAHG